MPVLILRRVAVAAIAVFLALPAFAQGGFEEVTVYTARVVGGIAKSDAELVTTAQTQGSVELMRFWEGAPLERLVITLGSPGIGFPGFTSLTRVEGDKALAAGIKTTDKGAAVTAYRDLGAGAAVEWSYPKNVGVAPFVTTVTLNGEWVYTETRTELAGPKSTTRPAYIRVDHQNGDVIVQYFDYDSPSPIEWQDPYAGFGGLDNQFEFIPKVAGDPAKAIVAAGVRFTSLHGFIFEYDSGFWPGGGTSPGSFPVQVRLEFGAAWARGGELNGRFFLESNGALTLSNANGRWWLDYGVELDTTGAVSVPILGSFEFELPYIPNFDYRLQKEAPINSWLFGTGATIKVESKRQELFDLDIVNLIAQAISGSSIPSWLGVAGGARLDGTLGVDATLFADQVSTSDGASFTTPWDTNYVELVNKRYNTTVKYDAHIDAALVARLYPELYLEVLFQRFDLPLGELRWSPVTFPIPLEFAPAPLAMSLPEDPATPEGEGAAEGETPAEGQLPEGTAEGEGRAEGETPVEGEFTTEGETLPEGEVPLPQDIECGNYPNKSGTRFIKDLETLTVTTWVEENDTVEDLAVWLDLYHPSLLDLSMTLTAPSGKRVLLFFQSGAGLTHMQDVTLWQGARREVSFETEEYAGLYRPVQSLDYFRGQPTRGLWTLSIKDHYLRNAGVLKDWSLKINPCGLVSDAEEGDATEGEIIAEGEPGPQWHSADVNPRDGRIGLQELLRVVQFFNVGHYACAGGTMDGYIAGVGADFCGPHSSDFQPQDWSINLQELLRLVQFFNSGGYYPLRDGPDGFAPGTKSD